jgi:hypothetical protein
MIGIAMVVPKIWVYHDRRLDTDCSIGKLAASPHLFFETAKI